MAINAILTPINPLQLEIDVLIRKISALRKDIATLDSAKSSWLLLDSDYTDLQTGKTSTFQLCTTPYGCDGLDNFQKDLAGQNDSFKLLCTNEINCQAQHLQSHISKKEQELTEIQKRIDILTAQLPTP